MCTLHRHTWHGDDALSWSPRLKCAQEGHNHGGLRIALPKSMPCAPLIFHPPATCPWQYVYGWPAGGPASHCNVLPCPSVVGIVFFVVPGKQEFACRHRFHAE